MSERRPLSPDELQLHWAEVQKRAQQLFKRVQNTEHINSPVPPDYEHGINAAALLLAGVAAAAYSLKCSTTVGLVASVYHAAETVTADQLLSKISNDILLAGLKPSSDRVM